MKFGVIEAKWIRVWIIFPLNELVDHLIGRPILHYKYKKYRGITKFYCIN